MRAAVLGAAILALVSSAGWAQENGRVGSAGRERDSTVAPPREARAADGGSRRAPARRPVRTPGRPGSFELSGGALWLARTPLGRSSATLTPNSGVSGFTLFTSSAELGGAVGAQGHLAFNLLRSLAVEGGFSYTRPQVRFTIASDAEQAPGFTSTGEHLAQYVVDGSLLVHLPFALAGWRPFLSGGGGYLRQLHQDTVAVETGRVYHAGGGLKYYFARGGRGLVTSLGLRLDARVQFGSGGFTFDGKATRSFGAGAGLVVAF